MTEVKADSPFIPGAKVAIRSDNGWRAPHNFRASIVAKAFKNGRFTLEGSTQQWRAHEPARHSFGDNCWTASETGHGRDRLRIWDASTDAEIAAQNAHYELYRRFARAQQAIERLSFDELVTGGGYDQTARGAKWTARHQQGMGGWLGCKYHFREQPLQAPRLCQSLRKRKTTRQAI